MISHHVSVKERGHTDVEPVTWTVLSNDAAFRRLLDTGILSAKLLANGVTRIQGSCYVGRAKCADVNVEIQEKVPGALASLLSYATGSAFRVERTNSSASDLGQLTLLLIQQFLAAVTEYASRSRKFVYEHEARIGCLGGGQIDVFKSIQLRARGLGHLLAFNKNVITFNTPLNRIILAALIEVERIGQLIDVEARVMERARGLSMLFSDCRDSRLLYGARSALAREAMTLVDSLLPPEEKDVAALASVVLSHEGFEWDTRTSSHVPRSWFLNLEKLFERAVMCQLQELVETNASVYPGVERPQPVFMRRTSRYRAHPDVVVAYEDGRVIVGDVKYKKWSRVAAASDLYQLLIHTAAYSGTQSFLVFPNDEYEAIWLGEAVTGADTRIFALDVRNLTEGIARMAHDLGIETDDSLMESSPRSGDL